MPQKAGERDAEFSRIIRDVRGDVGASGFEFVAEPPQRAANIRRTGTRAHEVRNDEILCYKLNDQWLSPKAGEPVRMLVPDTYGNKSVKWLQKVVLTNKPQANDTYAEWNNDTESPLKTDARFVQAPKTIKAGQPAAITGLAQVGPPGLTKVQYWLHPDGQALPANDSYFTKAPWKDAEVLLPPSGWAGGRASRRQAAPSPPPD